MKKVVFIVLLITYTLSQASAWDINPTYHMGNQEIFERFDKIDTPLKGKKILFLGSSVTRGAATEGFSFADMLQEKYGIIAVKEAVDGTTLADVDSNSYVSRLKKYTLADKFDAVVCQLSTNEAFRSEPLYSVDSVNSVEDGISFIMDYSKNKLNSKLIFYTSTPISGGGGNRYAQMVDLLNKMAKSKEIMVIDLFHNNELPVNGTYDYGLYMYDWIHPTKAGYKAWLPYFEKPLLNTFTIDKHDK